MPAAFLLTFTPIHSKMFVSMLKRGFIMKKMIMLLLCVIFVMVPVGTFAEEELVGYVYLNDNRVAPGTVSTVYFQPGQEVAVNIGGTDLYKATNVVLHKVNEAQGDQSLACSQDGTVLTLLCDAEKFELTCYVPGAYVRDTIYPDGYQQGASKSDGITNLPAGTAYTLGVGTYFIRYNGGQEIQLEVIDETSYVHGYLYSKEYVLKYPDMFQPIYAEVYVEPPKYDEPIYVSGTTVNTILNNSSMVLDAYNIYGNNFFKLRDVALRLSFRPHCSRPFEIVWNGETQTVNIMTNRDYTLVGGECGGSVDAYGEWVPPTNRVAIWHREPELALPAKQIMYVDGRPVEFIAYNIGGNNYVKLRDLCQAINFGVEWSDEAQAIILYDDRGYSE